MDKIEHLRNLKICSAACTVKICDRFADSQDASVQNSTRQQTPIESSDTLMTVTNLLSVTH